MVLKILPYCLFSRLTVEEHVWFYGRLKGMSSCEVKEETASLLEDVGLLYKQHEQTRNLSGALFNTNYSLCQNARESHVCLFVCHLYLPQTLLTPISFPRRHAEEAFSGYSLYRRF